MLGSERSAGERIRYPLQYSWASLVAQLVKNLPVMWKTWVQSLGLEDLLTREWLPTPVFWPGEFHGLYSPWVAKSLHDWVTFTFTFIIMYEKYLLCNKIVQSMQQFTSIYLTHNSLLCIYPKWWYNLDG